jgi:site-specific recombinase XerD
MNRPSNSVRGMSAIQSSAVCNLVDKYGQQLLDRGYNKKVVRFHLHAIVHFCVWLDTQAKQVKEIDDETVASFERHRTSCDCRATSRNRARQVLSCVRRFVQFLRSQTIVRQPQVRDQRSPMVAGFLCWMGTHRGVVETTLTGYARYVDALVEDLGEDPQGYSADALRSFVHARYGHYRSRSLRMVFAAVRMFLSYLVAEGKCRAGLEHALMPLANWSQQPLPRGIGAEDVRRVLAACAQTPRGLRDRAALLLLIRLGLRASEVAKLRLSDLNFEMATVRVCGKGRREARLPLPQELGEAILEYLRKGRPPVDSEFVFLRSVAPFGPFSMRHAGAGVQHIARAALRRAGVQSPSAGAHVFRHTAACQMLRQGVTIEAIAQVLRHRSVETTGIYAKVDVELLRQVAQPWPEAVRC